MAQTPRVSEIFFTLQGEGPSAGTPAHFLRLQGCTVGCRWCDTRYSWEAGGGEAIEPATIWERARSLGSSSLLVITGGEPLEYPGLVELLNGALERWPAVEVETSGVGPPPLSHPRLAWNVSPKLPSATPAWSESWRHAATWIAEPRATFKIVVGDPPDADDARRLVTEHRLPRERVMLMPEGLTDDAIRAHATGLAELCKREGWRLSPRLHIWMWGARRGV
jgi:7-carboxy-7-deazaguanine synthase